MKAGAMQGVGRFLRMILVGLGLLGLWPGSGWAAAPTVALAWFPTQSPTNPTVQFPFATTERLRANATPSTGATVVKVEYYAGTTLIGMATAGSTYYALYLATTSLGPGVYSLTAKVTDSLGATATSTAVPFTVIAPPTVAVTWAGSQNPSNPVFHFPFGSADLLRATATPTTGATVVKVEYYTGTTLIGTATAGSTIHALPLATTSLAPGVYSLSAKVTDSLGATATSAAVSLTVNARPTVTLTSPGANQVFAGSAPIVLSATAADSDGTIARVDFARDSVLIGTATTAPYIFTWTNAAVGSYTVAAKATDNRGASTYSAAVPITVTANSPPTVSLTSPTPNQSLTAPATINLAADAGDPDNNLVKVEFLQNGSLIATVLSAPYTATWNNVGQGSYQITAIATDAAGAQTTSAPATLTVTSAQANLYFIHADHLGTPRLVTDSANQVVWRHLPTTEPFGNTPPEEDPNATGNRFEMPLAFPGQYRDRESGLSYNYFRDYSSGEGRYRQSDPIGLQGGINTYSYVGGTPVSYVDPDGLAKLGRDGLNSRSGPVDQSGRQPRTGPAIDGPYQGKPSLADRIADKVLDRLFKEGTGIGGFITGSKGSVLASGLLYSKGLNEGEDAEVARQKEAMKSHGNQCRP